MFDFVMPLWGEVLLFLAAAAVIAVGGIKLASLADRFADRTGLGEALTGTIFLGLLTALPGLTASVIAAIEGHPALAISNALGGIAFQTTVLAVADIAHRDANLEHAAASAENVMQTIMLVVLLTLVSIGLGSPNVTLFHVHPVTILLLLAVIPAFWIVYRVRERPMWRPEVTEQTIPDIPAPFAQREHLGRLIAGLVVTGAITLISGGVIAHAAAGIVEKAHLPEAVVGGLFMAVTTSLPELVTSIAAVRRGALTLAVSNIVGGNFFDVLFVAAADLALVSGSLYHGPGVGRAEAFICSTTILLNLVLLAGLIYRQKHGPANIGLESTLMLILYLAAFLVVSLAM